MKEQKFFKLSQVNLPLDELRLEDNELISVKGGYVAAASGRNCNCKCSAGDGAGSGRDCNCDCTA